LTEVPAFNANLWVHAWQVGEDMKPVGALPPDCYFKGKYLRPNGSLFVPPQGYPGGDKTVVRRFNTNTKENVVIGKPGDITT
jgi:hypothetical protein